ncbi:hypothetical protein F4811DRAFT_2804 [Daldinia bambusicola]|nr:hypothetical protein F4811DRAFT_2804 [Daldinia bambusicola]
MPMTFVSCLLCGAPIEDISHPITWLHNFHVVYTILENWNEARLSGPGERRQFENVIPLDKSVDANIEGINYEAPEIEIQLMATEFGRIYPPALPLIPQPAWGFAVHSSCLEIINIAARKHGRRLDIQALFDLCRSQPQKNGILDWGHDYEGLIGYEGRIGFPKYICTFCPGEEPPLSLANARTDVYTHDPLNIPQLYRLFTHSAKLFAPMEGNVLPKTSADFHNGSDPLNALPTEMLHMILVWMDSKGVANLRLASRACASLVLPDIFWRSRFWEGREFEYVFEENTSDSPETDWRQLFQQMKFLTALPSLANRKRVWSLARHLCDLIDRKQSYNICNGTPVRTLFEPGGALDSTDWITAGPRLYEPTESFWGGARSLYDRKVKLETPSKSISVSIVPIKKKIYISGIRFVHNDDQNIALGYCKSNDGITATWEKQQQSVTLVGFHVAFDNKGIRGIRILSVSGELSDWIGDWQNLSQRMLVLPTRLAPQDIKGGFDALKLVSLSISGGEDESPGTSQSSIFRETAIWHGAIPPEELSFLGPCNKRIANIRDNLPFSLALFGGVDGMQLPYLTGITIWVVDNTALCRYADRTHIWGIKFSLDNPSDGKSSILLGQIPDAGWSNSKTYHMNLDSSRGERITGLETFYEDPTFIFGLKVYTNRGRAIEFPPACTDELTENEYFSDVLKLEDGTIVGIYAVLKHGDLFRSIGVAHIPQDTSVLA